MHAANGDACDVCSVTCKAVDAISFSFGIPLLYLALLSLDAFVKYSTGQRARADADRTSGALSFEAL